MPVKLSSAGGGSVTLDTPSTASNYTVTLPAANATLADTSSTQTLTNKTLTAAGSNTVEATSGPTSSQLAGNRNKIINGAMMIDQRNAGASVTPVGGDYTLDRWQCFGNQPSKYTVQQNAGSIIPPAGFAKYFGVTSTSAYTVLSGDYFLIRQTIEGLNCFDLAWGTISATTVTLSFWVRSSLTGTFGGSVQNAGQTRSYPFTYVISSANTWTYITVTIPGETTGTWLTTNGAGILLNIGLGVGSTYSGAAGSWSSNVYLSATGATSVVGTNGATFYITGVQLEKGATATPFENRLYGAELALCQRYCVNYNSANASNTYFTYGYGSNITTTRQDYAPNFPVQMRVTPSLTTTGTASNYAIYQATTGTISCSAVPYIAAGSFVSCQIISTTAGSLTAGQCTSLISNSNNTSYLLFTAEL